MTDCAVPCHGRACPENGAVSTPSHPFHPRPSSDPAIASAGPGPSSGLLALAAALALLFVATPDSDAQVVINEFMAGNTRTLADEDGDYPDWIELHHTGSTPIQLAGWTLTDSAAEPGKWTLPAITLPPDGYLIVFASDKDRRDPTAPLHTNFRLTAAGEYLGLYRPGEAEPVSAYAPTFPPQVNDVSYGLDAGFRKATLVGTNASGRFRVPSGPEPGGDALAWTRPGYDDSAWSASAGALGFAGGTVAALGFTNDLAGYWRFDESSGTNAADSSGFNHPGFLRNFPADHSQWVPGRLGGALRFRGGPFNDHVVVTNYSKSTTQLTVSAWVWADSRPTWASIVKNWPGGNASHFHFGLTDTSGDLSNYIRQNNGDYGLREGVLFPVGSWQHVAFVLDATTERLYRNGVQVASAPYSGTLPTPTFAPLAIGAKVLNTAGSADSFWHGRMDEIAIWNRALSAGDISRLAAGDGGYEQIIRTQVRTAMAGQNATVQLRLPFVVDNPARHTRWALRMRYDDGFVVWLNGTEIARRNAPESPDWNSAATGPASETEEVFSLTDAEPLFVAGTNVLAIQGLNVAADDADFLLAPTLTATLIDTPAETTSYFTEPTPGAANLVGVQQLGPILASAAHAPEGPLDGQDLAITVRVAPAFAAVTNVTLRYRIMYSNEVALAMFDDGAHGDGPAGDGVFGAAIPASASTNGQMIRYRITAADASGATSRLPAFLDPLDSEEYFGTVVLPPSSGTALPVVHWFVQSPSLAETDAGTRCSIYYGGEFYDNVFIRIRGGTARSWPKKSYKVELNENHEFLPLPGWRRVTEFDLNATYTDKSYARARMTAEMGQDAGLPSPETFHVQLRQNAAFYSVALFVEQPDKDFLIRQGLDPLGALYKCNPGATYDTVAAFEKKTRRTEDKSDAQALLNGLGLTSTALENFVFDAVDLPGMVNFIAIAALTQNIDATDKNHFLYRDTNGSGEWRMLPWDLDLTFGPDALNTDTIVYQLQNTNSPACASHPFIGSRPYLLHAGKYNRLIEAVTRVPRSRDMVLRRIRTLADRYLVGRYFENRLDELGVLLGPDVLLDRARWGVNAHFGGATYTLPAAAARIKNEYLTPRYGYLTGTNIAGVGFANPAAQPLNAILLVAGAEPNPASGNQAEEYLVLTNAAPFPMDLSGWRVEGAVRHAFKPATVIPAQSVLYLSPDVAAFRRRATGPRGGQGLFVQGNYEGSLSARGETIRLLDPYGRLAHSLAYPANPGLQQQFLRVTELHYHPAPGADTAASLTTTNAEDFEFIELRNISSSTPVPLAGVRFTDGVMFDFSTGAVATLAPGQRVVVVRHAGAFAALRAAAGSPVPPAALAGEFSGSLDNGGERLRLIDAAGEEILDFTFSERWHPITDGHGFSLVTVDDQAAPDLWSSAGQWQAGRQRLGTPGAAEPDPAPPLPPDVVIHEVLSRSDTPPPTDSIELRNVGPGPADVGGWFLTDDFNAPRKYRIPDGTVLAAGGLRVFSEADFNPGGTGFALGSDGDEVWLFSADGTGRLTGRVHGFRFGAALDGVTFGRHLDSLGREQFVAQSSATLGAANAGPRVGPVVISEIHYRPPDEPAGTDNDRDEFIELHNGSAAAMPLFDPLAVTNTWRLAGGVDFTLPPGLTLPAGGSLLIVNFDPVADPAALARFQARFNPNPATPIVGPYEGRLNNDNETVELLQPTTPIAGRVPHVVADLVEFNDTAPWPPGADGYGLSLQRLPALLSFGNDPASWRAAPPSPGSLPGSAAVVPVVITSPASVTAALGGTTTLSVGATGPGPLRYQWRFNGDNLAGATNAVLPLTGLQPSQAGPYEVVVYNDAGSAVSAPATVTLLYPPTILAQPQAVTLRGSTNAIDYGSTTNRSATFSVLAYSPEPITYQWRANGVPIPGATSSSLVVPNVTLAQDGVYDVVVGDSIASLASIPARLTVFLSPLFVVPPVNQFVVQGGSFTAGTEIKGNPTPFGYVWRQGTTPLSTVVTNATRSFLFRTNVQPSMAGTYRVIVTNAAQPNLLINATFTVTVLPDADGDRLPDSWETAYGFPTNQPAGALTDTDGDGLSDLNEYQSGTNPLDPQSYLRIESFDTTPTTRLTFQAASNLTYRVEGSGQNPEAPWVWSPVAEVPAHPTNRTATITVPGGGPQSFYRLVTPIPAPPAP